MRSTRVLGTLATLALVATGATSVALAGPAAATPNPTILVTTTADVIDGGDGLLSLREAVILANATAGDDTIQLADGATYGLTICGPDANETDPTVGDLNATGSDTITITGGAGFTTPPTIHQTCAQRVIAAATGPLDLAYLDLTGGNSGNGGSIHAGGALTLDHVDESAASNGGAFSAFDGAIYAVGRPLSVVGSSIHDNTATGVYLAGTSPAADAVFLRASLTGNSPSLPAQGPAGAIYTASALTIDQSDISDNVGAFVGGLASFGGALITDSTISGNTGDHVGGVAGVFSLIDSQLTGNTTSALGNGTGGGGMGQFTILRSTVSGNHSGLMAGGLVGVGTITDSTISGNDTSGIGGGIVAEPNATFPADPSLVVTDSTITGNTGHLSGGILALDDWYDTHYPGSPPPAPVRKSNLVLRSATIVGNTGISTGVGGPVVSAPSANDITFARYTDEPVENMVGSYDAAFSAIGGTADNDLHDCELGAAAPVVSPGYNFTVDPVCGGGGQNNIVGDDPGLAPLADNGGPTLTMMPVVGSPLIDQAMSAPCNGTDQRGFPRLVGFLCDIGAVEAPPILFHPVTPARIVDTRPEPQRVGPLGSWGSAETHDVTVVGGSSGVPDTAVAVVLSVTATGGTANGDYLSIWPSGAAQPTVSSLNVDAGKTVANQVTVKVGTDGLHAGKISIFNAGGTQDVIVDVNGYYDTAGGDGFTGMRSTRIVDSRPAPQRVGSLGPWSAGQTQEVTVVGGLSGVPTDADAVILNVTATGGSASGNYLSIWPTGAAQPTVSNVNVNSGQTVANAVTVKLGTGGSNAGKISIFSAGGTQSVIVDVVGYFRSGTGDGFHPIDPGRVVDTRDPPQRVGNALRWGPDYTQAVWFTTDTVDVPFYATGVVTNVTATGGTVNGDYLTAFLPTSSRPNASTLNFDAGQTVANAATVGTNAKVPGAIAIYNAGGFVDVIVDVSGYYA